MAGDKPIKLEDLRQPGMRRVLEAMKAIEEERPGLVENAALAAGELAKNRGDGGRMPE
jgi:hypothetical protein